MRSFRKDKRGVSNVIVFVLGLVIVTVIVANVFLWNFEMNQLDWERMQEDFSIVNVASIIDTWSYNPSGYSLGGSTSLVSGSVSNLTLDDGDYMIFRSYYSGTDTTDFVDQTSDLYLPSAKGTHSDFPGQQTGPDSVYDTLTEENTGGEIIEDYVDNNISDVDNSPDIGTHSSFLAQQAGPDSIYDILTEENTGGASNTTLIDAESFEGGWPPSGWSGTGYWNKESNQAYNGFYSADFDGGGMYGYSGDLTTPDLDCSDAEAIYIDFWYRDEGCESGEFMLRYYDGAFWDTISDLGSTTSEWQWLHYQEKITDSQYFKSTFKVRWSAVGVDSFESAYVDYVTVKKEVPGADNYELDLEIQFTSVIDFLSTEELCIYTGTLGSEDLKVGFWNGAGWQNLATDLTSSSWNNYTVSLTSATFTVRFKGGDETGDTSQDQWQIDASLLRVEGGGSKEDAVDNDTSDVDGSADVGTLSNFDSMKTKDGMATLTEVAGGTPTDLQVPTTCMDQMWNQGQDYEWYSAWTPPGSGTVTVTKLWFWDGDGTVGTGETIYMAMYEDGGGYSKLSGSDTTLTGTGSQGWLSADVSTSFEMTLGTTYWIGATCASGGTYNICRDDGANCGNYPPNGVGTYYQTNNYVLDSSVPTGASQSINKYIIPGITYTTGTGDYELDQEVQWTDVPYLLPNENLSIYGGPMGDEDIKVDVWNGTGWENIFTDLSSGWNNASITDWLTTSNFTIRFKGGTEIGDSSQDTWDIDVALIHVWDEEQNYELDLEVQWTSADYDKTSEELCIRTGTFSGSEDIQVKIWNHTGSYWGWVMNLTASQWNNVSVTSYLTTSTFTIQFLGGTESSDTTQDSWNIDVTLLHVWSDQYTAEVEFTGSSNTEDWTQLNWTIDSAWTVGSVAVTLQLYNYTLDGYPTSGNGYMSYTSSALENTDETERQTITVNPTHFRNATGYWKMKVRGVKATDTQFDFKADWIEFKPVKAGGTRFTFENTGSLTCHLVSLWIINSTVHQHYDTDVFINSGDTYNYVRDNIDLPDGQVMVKVVTERGNIGVYSIG